MLSRSAVASSEERISCVSLIDLASAPFELRAGPYEPHAFAVVSSRGREAISQPFSGVVPALWLMKKRTNSRIFQGKARSARRAAQRERVPADVQVFK